MIGGGFGCTFNTKREVRDCRFTSAALAREQQQEDDGPFFFIGGEHTFSTGKNGRDSEGQEIHYRFFRVHRVALTPSVSVRNARVRLGSTRIYHAVGMSHELFFGCDFRRFYKFAVTVTPIEFVLFDDNPGQKKWSLAAKVRYYPDGVTHDEFGPAPRRDYDRPDEWTFGAGVSVIWKGGSDD
jgi:hypothetical protein